MNKNEIDLLLSKFYRGETTLDEEQQLRNAMGGDSVDALLMKELEGVDNEIEVPADLESSLSDMIDEWDAQEQQEAKVAPVAPSMWRRASWIAAAASVAVVATVGLWMMRNRFIPTTPEINPPMIAKTDVKPEQGEVEHTVEPAKTSVEPQVQQPRHIHKPSATLNPEVEHLAQVSEKPSDKSLRKSIVAETRANAKPSVKTSAKSGDEPVRHNLEEELSPEEELLAMEALEKFSTTLNKGMEQLNEAGEKIDNINNTIKQYLL